MRILVLYTRLTGYWMACMRNDYHRTGNEYLVIRKKPGENAPFDIHSEKGISIIDGDDLTTEDLEQKADALGPDLVYVSGWTDKRYRAIAKKYRALNIPVILGMDNHWKGSLKQHVASFVSAIYLKQHYSHIWIPGMPQYHFARKLGFKDSEIWTGLYCADVNLFSHKKPRQLNRQITFIGRLVEHKGVHLLCRALQELISEDKLTVDVHFIGSGPLKDAIPGHPGIKHTPFVSPEDLPEKLTGAGFLILPSLYEAWGVVLHEAACTGLPLISTHETGAVSEFLIHGYNGFVYNAHDERALVNILKQVGELSEKQYVQFSNNSKHLSERIDLDTWSATLNSVV